MGIHSLPFDVASNGIREGNADRIAINVLLQSVCQVVDRHLADIAGIIYSTTGVYKFTIAVKDIKMRSA
jgi:hypothetical protein